MKDHTSNFRSRIDLAKKLMPLPKLMKLLNDDDAAERSALCPFHDDTRPSFSVFQGDGGKWFWKCHAGCGHGDEIDYVEVKFDISRADAIREFLDLAGVKEGGAK